MAEIQTKENRTSPPSNQPTTPGAIAQQNKAEQNKL